MQTTFSELEYAGKKKQTRRDRFVAEIDTVTPWAALLAALTPHYPKGEGRGRPPIGLEGMLRIYVAQQCFGLSDEGTEDAVYDSQSIRRFVGIDLSREAAPDATTLLKFRRLLETHQLTRSVSTPSTRIWLRRVCCSRKARSLMPRSLPHRRRSRSGTKLVTRR